MCEHDLNVGRLSGSNYWPQRHCAVQLKLTFWRNVLLRAGGARSKKVVKTPTADRTRLGIRSILGTRGIKRSEPNPAVNPPAFHTMQKDILPKPPGLVVPVPQDVGVRN